MAEKKGNQNKDKKVRDKEAERKKKASQNDEKKPVDIETA